MMTPFHSPLPCLNVDEADLLFINRLTVTSFSKYEVMKSCLYMVERRMTEPEDTLTKHGIKRVFVVLLILRILWEVGTQQPQSGVVATTTQVTLTVLTKAETAQKSRSDVEFEPAMATAKAEDIATQAEDVSQSNLDCAL